MAELLTKKKEISRQDLEVWLANSLVPVEPDAEFVRTLKARLIHYSGGKAFSIWMAIGSVAIGLLLIIGWVSMVLRAVFVILGLLGLLGNRGVKSQPAS